MKSADVRIEIKLALEEPFETGMGPVEAPGTRSPWRPAIAVVSDGFGGGNFDGYRRVESDSYCNATRGPYGYSSVVHRGTGFHG